MKKNLALKILDAILISSRRKVKIKTLKNFFKDLNFEELVDIAQKRYQDFGFFLKIDNDYLELVNRPELFQYLINFFKFEDNEIIQEFLEVLAIVAYAGPISLRGVNKIRNKDSLVILKELLNEGLIKKEKYYYKISDKFLDFFGFQSLEDLPDYYRLRKELKGKD